MAHVSYVVLCCAVATLLHVLLIEWTQAQMMEMDFEIGCIIKDKLIPFSVLWFTGEAAEYDDDDDDDDMFDDDEGDGMLPHCSSRPPRSSLHNDTVLTL